MKKVTVLCGVPACGKSTWRDAYVTTEVVISSDDLIDQIAGTSGKTYDEIFAEEIAHSDRYAKAFFRLALKRGLDIVIDRTNLTPSSRAIWINEAKRAGYTIEAVWFDGPEGLDEAREWKDRLDGRTGKSIPWGMIIQMILSQKRPTLEEGFDRIVTRSNF